jgi:signal transduction histidine kinase
VQNIWHDPVLCGAFLAVGVVLIYQLVVTLLQPIWIGTVTDGLRVLLAWPALLGVVSFSLWLTHRDHRLARSWWLVSAALFCNAVGRTIWMVENLLIAPHHVPFPSLPDFLFLLEFPLLLLSLLAVPPVRPKIQRARAGLDGTLLLASALILSWYFVLAPIYQGSHESLVGKLLNLIYPVGSLAICVGLVLVWLHAEQYVLPRAEGILLLAAMACLVVAYSWFAVLLLHQRSYQSGSPPDLFWMACWLLLPLAALVQFRLTRHLPRGEGAMPTCQYSTSPKWEDLIASLHVTFPVACALLVGAIVVIGTYLGKGMLSALVPSLAALALLGLALLRQGLSVVDNERLRREREDALRDTTAQMETFLGVAGHELKNPLASMKLSLQLAVRRLRQLSQREPETAPSLEPVLETVARADRQEHRLDRLVDELLDASRIQSGKLELHLEPADLVAIVREVVQEQSQLNPQRTLYFACPGELHASVLADTDRIGEVVTNYLTNALKYSPANTPVEIGVGVETWQARVWVRDHGPGLAPEEQERIWERFHRTEGIEVQSGTGVGLGLGLHISQIIIELHHGQVGVQSAPGEGSTFWFTLPLTAHRAEHTVSW